MIFSEITMTPSDRSGRELAGRLRANPYRQHQALWTLFPRQPGSTRPFLFRWCDGAGHSLKFFTLSDEAPQATEPWTVRSKAFDPRLRKDDVLGFELRINPTLNVATTDVHPRSRGRRVDVVMHAIHGKDDRAEARSQALESVLPEWFARRARTWGFELATPPDDDCGFQQSPCRVLRYERWKLRKNDQEGIVLGVADLAGELRVTDPDRFRQALCRGLGPGKAFGLGLMLLRRLG
jgi:CRISPR system Cascade subunit CasE